MTSETGETGLDSLLSVAMGFMTARVLLAAVQLGVFTRLGDGPRDRARLAAETGLHPRCAADFLDTLVSLGLLRRDGDTYRNGPDADLYLDREKPTYVGGLLERLNHEGWASLTEALRDGEPRSEQGGQVGMPEPRILVERLDWSAVRRVVEIGGSGALSVQLAQAYPHVSGGVLGAAPEYAGDVERLFLADRLEAFATLPPADAYVLGGVLSRLGAAERPALLAELRAALSDGGMVIVYDTMLDDERRRNTTGLLSSLGLLLETPAGRQSTVAECGRLLTEAGLREVTTEDLGHGWSAIMGVK
ncbi:methyltransferase [Actinoplanes sp. NBRC 103695]|uniref:methyltransferase n=1 Tax=Actinoplanes sp. NBRC 103695 TaxID=3032202 RepID=UPI0024A173E4|nr:methyltransferase [Actinoplanes sp. NBRC 103695]GLY98756.1 O-methyltransferase [Actinoplanes sp. NBRC 103695]